MANDGKVSKNLYHATLYLNLATFMVGLISGTYLIKADYSKDPINKVQPIEMVITNGKNITKFKPTELNQTKKMMPIPL